MYNGDFCSCRRVALIVVSIVMLVVTFLGLGKSRICIFCNVFILFKTKLLETNFCMNPESSTSLTTCFSTVN